MPQSGIQADVLEQVCHGWKAGGEPQTEVQAARPFNGTAQVAQQVAVDLTLHCRGYRARFHDRERSGEALDRPERDFRGRSVIARSARIHRTTSETGGRRPLLSFVTVGRFTRETAPAGRLALPRGDGRTFRAAEPAHAEPGSDQSRLGKLSPQGWQLAGTPGACDATVSGSRNDHQAIEDLVGGERLNPDEIRMIEIMCQETMSRHGYVPEQPVEPGARAQIEAQFASRMPIKPQRPRPLYRRVIDRLKRLSAKS